VIDDLVTPLTVVQCADPYTSRTPPLLIVVLLAIPPSTTY
jgi:hypothetical protein